MQECVVGRVREAGQGQLSLWVPERWTTVTSDRSETLKIMSGTRLVGSKINAVFIC